MVSVGQKTESKVTVIRLGDMSYTPAGIKRISKAIQATLGQRSWSERDLTRAIQRKLDREEDTSFKAAHGTINRYAAGLIKNPQDRVLREIAPFIYRVVAINGDEVFLDTSRTYDDWREFARIGTNNFVEGLPGEVMSTSPIADFIRHWRDRQSPPVTIEEFELAIRQRTELDVERFRAIASGSIPSEEIKDLDLLWIGAVLRNQEGSAYPLDYLKEIRDGIATPDWCDGECKKR
jgi:hypothetical protein